MPELQLWGFTPVYEVSISNLLRHLVVDKIKIHANIISARAITPLPWG